MKTMIHQMLHQIPVYDVKFRCHTFSCKVKRHWPAETSIPEKKELESMSCQLDFFWKANCDNHYRIHDLRFSNNKKTSK